MCVELQSRAYILGVATRIPSGIDSLGCDVDVIAAVALSKAATKQ